MIFQETSTTFLPCNQKLEAPLETDAKSIDLDSMIKREESNGTITFIDPKTKKVFFLRDDKNIFPLDVPIQVDIEITQKCNLNCKHCFLTEKNELFSENTIKVLKRLVDSGVLAFELIGGEPFLVKEIFSIIDYLKKHNKIVSISTNGTLITEEIAKKLSINPPSKIFVSIDGPKKINDLIRGEGSFDKTIKGIKNLNKAGITPSIAFCITKLNIDHIKELVDETKELRIKSFFFICGEPKNKNCEFNKNFFNHSEREELSKKIDSMNLLIKYTINFAPKQDKSLYHGCFFRLTMCEITPSGNVLSCPVIRRKEGNVLKEDFKDIWKRMQEKLVQNKPKRCKGCEWKKRCFPCEFDKI